MAVIWEDAIGVDKPDYDKALRDLDEAGESCETADEYIDEIMRIWAKNGLLQGEWSCKLDKAG